MKKVLIGGLYPNAPFVAGKNISYYDLLSEICEVVNVFDGNQSNFDFFVCVDFKKEDVDFARSKGISKSKSLLIRQEPNIVWPKNYSKEVEDFFGMILNVGKSPGKNYADFWPQDFDFLAKDHSPQARNSKQVLLLNSNRCSLIKGEMYSLRKKAARKLSNIDVYGRDWEISFLSKIHIAVSCLKIALGSGHFPSLRALQTWLVKSPKNFGPVPNKSLILKQYVYSLVIENEMTYVSEKIFDSFRAGCIPIYVGPDLKPYGIPSSLYVKAQPNIASIESAIAQLAKFDYENWQHELNAWLSNSVTIERWSYWNFGKRFQDLVTRLVTI